jgi:hypothetical protein
MYPFAIFLMKFGLLEFFALVYGEVGGVSGCINPNALPSGSTAMAIEPAIGTGCLSIRIFPPALLLL